MNQKSASLVKLTLRGRGPEDLRGIEVVQHRHDAVQRLTLLDERRPASIDLEHFRDRVALVTEARHAFFDVKVRVRIELIANVVLESASLDLGDLTRRRAKAPAVQKVDDALLVRRNWKGHGGTLLNPASIGIAIRCWDNLSRVA